MDVLLFPLRTLALAGFLSLAVGVIYLAFQVVVYFILRTQIEAAYRLWLLSLDAFRALVTLPMLSAVMAILAGVGVNLVTGGGTRDDFLSGLQLIFLGVSALLIFGFTLAASYRPQSSARALARRIMKISAGLEDPFVSLESAQRLTAELRRHASVGERLIDVARLMRFRKWALVYMGDKELRRMLAVAFAAPLATAVVIFCGLSREVVPIFVHGFVLVGLFCGALAPVLHFLNERKRQEVFGGFLVRECRAVLLKLKILEKRRNLSLTESPGSGVRADRKGSYAGVRGRRRGLSRRQ
ncbi:hypothetical protein OG989_30500 [Micromonospora sp. NBC_01740]|uniref:hypothetical protein n=1 Tax=Micromonospora sp. NBC_01740 TaxID=2975986 RepID=UPI002E0D5869|nr:hypothetical protein OG989_30500 [Micromonospora sp. NBC_01740]